jgi:hypothetical protein
MINHQRSHRYSLRFMTWSKYVPMSDGSRGLHCVESIFTLGITCIHFCYFPIAYSTPPQICCKNKSSENDSIVWPSAV